jgi:hypothetical protein
VIANRSGLTAMSRERFEAELGRGLIGRERFAADIRRAVAQRVPYATGKAGISEQAILRYPMVLATERDPRRRRAFELALGVKSLPLSGIFPSDPEFQRRFASFYSERLAEADSLGLVPATYDNELELLRWHHYRGEVLEYVDQEPDRSIPADDAGCWLPALRGRDLLLVCPFAELLRERATESTFEAIWAKTGKRWFKPRSVSAIEFPYGYEPETQERYADALELLAEIEQQMASRAFDVALIAAGGLGLPLAVFAKRLGKVGISLGGHLQIVFGVHGERWLQRPDWRRDYFNDAWIRVPERYRPDMRFTAGDYW